MENDALFLTVEEAIRAICIDFHQYGPQPMLFAEIIRLISHDSVHIKRVPGKEGAWITRAGHTPMRWVEGPQLIEFMCNTIQNTRWDIDLLTDVCRRVFQARVMPANDPETGRDGVLIHTEMQDYTCRQCGNCCRQLDYHKELTQADVDLWKKLGRGDILQWVEAIRHKDAPVEYRIWVSPKTHRVAETCPFLQKDPTANRWRCRIHDVKPGICRQYPISRKHARMTGCPAFDKKKAK